MWFKYRCIDCIMIHVIPSDPSIEEFFKLSEPDKVIVIRIGLQCLERSKDCSSEEFECKMIELEKKYTDKLESSENKLKQQKDIFHQYQESSRDMTNELINDVRRTEYIKYDADINQMKLSISDKDATIKQLHSDMIQHTRDLNARYDGKMSEMINRYECKIKEMENKIENFQMLQVNENGRNNNSTLKGREGELIVFSKLQTLFPKSEIEDTHNIPRRGDFIIRDDELTMMVETKNYSRNVPKAEIDKFYRDLDDVLNKDVQCAVFVSLTTGICNKDDFSFEIYNNIPILFIHKIQDHMESLLIASGFFRMLSVHNIDITNKEMIDYYRQVATTIKRNFTKQKGRIERFCREQLESISEQELSIISLYKKANMKY